MKPGTVTALEKWRKGWTGGLPETVCGYGARLDQTIEQRKTLARWVKEYNVTTLADIGAGDMNWIRHIEWPHPVAYIPLDLVPRHPDVREFDLVEQVPPPCDMVLCLWVINHIPEERARAAWANLLKTDCRYIVYTYWPAMWEWSDVPHIDSISLRENIQAELRLIQC